jgi:urease accessory protein
MGTAMRMVTITRMSTATITGTPMTTRSRPYRSMCTAQAVGTTISRPQAATTVMTTITLTTMGMTMDMRTNIPTEVASTAPAALPPASLLQLLWLASPALPVGGFSYSEGLESAVDAGHVRDADTASEWLTHQLHLALARADLAVIAQALRAWRAGDTARVQALNDWLLQTRESAELRLQTEQMGRSLREWLRKLPQADAAVLDFAATLDPSYPVMFALTASGSGASERDVLLAYTFGWAENMMQAALKAVPLGQTAGQHILSRLTHEIPVAVERALSVVDEERQAYSPMLAILSSQHETQYSRLFRS